MRLLDFVLVVAFCVTAQCADAAGLRLIATPADASGPSLQIAVWSPCSGPPGEVKLRSRTLRATADCAVDGERLPLVVISHGYGGYFTSHHDIAETLADAGFVVAALNHPIDAGGGDMGRADTLSVLVERPADIKRLIDYMLGAWPDRSKLDPDEIGFFGFSRGGYTGLVVAGGNPDIRKAIAFCTESFPKPSCEQLRRNEIPSQAPPHDPRIKAAVIADPAWAPLFDREGLKDVKIPIQLWASQLSGEDMTGGEVTADYVAAVDRELPIKPDYRVVSNAGHFAFIPPCPPDMAKTLARICSDRPGFDRAAFHEQFNADVLAFFRERLIEARRP
jgi:predicted dienelactone hydrolase